jgi:pyrimidine-nucleoside phosphorylase
VLSARDGHVVRIAARDVGIAALWLGAGRRSKEDDIVPAVGIELAKKVGDRVAAGEPLAYLLHADRGVEQAQNLLGGAIAVAEAAPDPVGSRVIEVLR